MPRAKKYVTKLQPLTADDIEEQLQRTVIINPGSRYIRMSRPNDREAVVLPHCIARRLRKRKTSVSSDEPSSEEPAKTVPTTPPLPEPFFDLDEFGATKEFKSALAAAETWLKENTNEEKAPGRTYCSFEAKESEENVPATKEFAVGNEALDIIALNPNYILNWPLRLKRFNTHEGPNGSRSAVAADLEDIWDRILTEELKIPQSARTEHRAVLIVPDIYDRNDVHDMVEIIMNSLDFFACFVVLESVASAFGACLSSACVVDVGAECTLISCVDDGISIPDTRILLHYGGEDITRLANWYFQQKFRAFTLRLNTYANWIRMDAIKEALCHSDFALQGIVDQVIKLPSPDREETVHMRMPHEFARVPCMALFFPGLIAPERLNNLVRYHQGYEGSCEDIYGGTGKMPKKSPKKVQKPEDDQNVSMQNDTEAAQTGNGNSASEPASGQFIELHKAIYWSITRCASDDQQKKMLRNILVVGGGLGFFPGVLNLLRQKLEEVVPPTQEIVLTTNSREVPPDIHAPKGASIMAALETAQFLWITKEEWSRFGVKILREKSCFAW
ncbi:actin-related protein 8-like [Paramacrobiotus metropolitanus]|uniref:actin-related protein 8-like n=1 Tax=Paramacrobiotus metropolitanus TaxID=2943436 RepID=UPI002445DE70|nr:actin-related protein 8-like [Paramacrobiotus metropolitanus]